MTIRFLQAWNGYFSGQIAASPRGSMTEAQLVAAGLASYDLDGDASNLSVAKLLTDPITGAASLVDGDGIPVGIGGVFSAHNQALLRQECDTRKANLIGVGTSKGVIALRFDDGEAAFSSTVLPLLQARGLPWSLALISRWTEQPWGVGVTAANIKSWVDRGGEIWSHGLDHKDYLGYQGLYDNIVLSKTEIEAAINVKVQGFSLPGITPIYTEEQRGSEYTFDRLTSYDDYRNGTAGKLIMATYPLSEAYVGQATMPVGRPMYHGRSHWTISDGVTLATALSNLDLLITGKMSARVMCHPYNLGGAGNMSVADFTTWLDAVVAAWNAGTLDVVMPSSLPYVTTSNYRYDILRGQGSFVGLSGASPGNWSALDTGGYNTLYATGGYNNGPYIDIPVSGGSGPTQRPTLLLPAGDSFMFEGWCKSTGATNTVPRVLITSYVDTTALNLNVPFTGITNAAWVKVRVPFTIPPKMADGSDVTRIAISPSRNSGDSCGWSDLKVVKI